MKILLTIILFFSYFNMIGQKSRVVKLIDSYSLEQINLDHSFIINNKHYSIDSNNSFIIIEKPFSKALTITSNQYEVYQEKIDFKKQLSDTLKIQLIPNQILIKKRHNEIWKSENQSFEISEFSNLRSLERKMLSYLNYLSVIDEFCDNEMCSYSNTYNYQINFVKTDSVYTIEKIEKLKPREYNCEELDKHLKLLESIFPKFIIKEESEHISLQFMIVM